MKIAPFKRSQYNHPVRPLLQNTILDLVRALPSAEIQNALMPLHDNDIAMAMLYMSDAERGTIFRHLSSAKASRVREEVARNEHVRILYSQYEIAAGTVIAKLRGDRGVKSARRYFKPRRS